MITSVQTFQIKGRGTVKIVRLADLDKDYRVGDGIDLDGERWAILGVEMSSPQLGEVIGIVVKRLLPHEASCKLGLALGPVAIECEHGFDVCPKCDPCSCSTVEVSS